MNLKQALRRILAAAALMSAGYAHAELYNFDLTGSYTAHWQLDSNAIPDEFVYNVGFAIYDVAAFPDALLGMAHLYFYKQRVGGALQIYDYYGSHSLLSTEGSQLYTGLEDAPVFQKGVYALTRYDGPGSYTLTISAAVPEPHTYAMLLAGLGLAGMMVRRRS